MLVKASLKSPIITPEKRKSTKPRSLISVFKMIVEDFEKRNPNDISITKITQNKNVQHRRVYDFFNMLTTLNICQYINKGKLKWNGVSSLNKTIQDAYIQIEIDSLDCTISSLFCVGPSPSLGSIAINFLCLFMYFGVDTFFFKNASMLFYHPSIDIKSLERRIYLVLNFLEVLGIVSHTSKTSEYRLNMNVKSIVENAINSRINVIKRRNSLSLENLLSRIDCHYIDNLWNSRRNELYAYTKISLI